MNITQYLAQLDTRFKSGISRENSYRADLESLIRELVQGVEITNEPANVTDCGNPDYVITRKKIPIGYIEAKDIDKDLKNKTYKEQFDRYKKALDNLVLTNYLWFQFFQDGELVHEIRIGEIEGNKIIPLTENFAQFETLVQSFCTFVGQTIKSSKKLAEMMAAKARLLENILERAVTSDEETHEDSSLKSQFETFKNILIHDLTPKGFADIYAQTLAYGMFAARLHDPSLQDFSRQEAAELIPKTNPFLRKLFQYVAGYDIDQRIKTTVDNLAEVFRATDVNALLSNFGKSTQANDPIIHFYETFLTEYDPKLRKSRGVWYTPEPVVKFIVRAVDDILKTEFNLPDGLADTSKTKIKIKDFAKATADMRSKTKQIEREVEVHKVQILDPATGTGTFLAEVVKHIYSTRFQAMQGAWSGYVEEHLIPRLNGFEILMASYSMAHLKLDMLLNETGYKPKREQRFNIYLTNSLEEHHPDTGTLFANWLSSEANEANYIKRDTPVMCVIGNPPYSVSSSNKSGWIENLTADYKKDLNERNIQPLSDDYIKFIRFGQYFIEKNGEGILAYISNNSFIDGLIHRQMRKNLMETFDKIYILDLHGNSKKKETAPDGGKDENVFDIMQGVSINIFVKKRK
jgi:type I restriction-modification system DNA methylase subunit